MVLKRRRQFGVEKSLETVLLSLYWKSVPERKFTLEWKVLEFIEYHITFSSNRVLILI